MSKEIKLTRGFVMLVSDHRFEEYSQYYWQYQPPRREGDTGYAKRGEYDPVTRKMKSIMAHNQIMNPPKGFEVDHLNHNGLDNRDENLEIKTKRGNIRNRRKYKNNTSGHENVYFLKRAQVWEVKMIRGYKTKEEAIAVAKIWKEFWDMREPELMKQEYDKTMMNAINSSKQSENKPSSG